MEKDYKLEFCDFIILLYDKNEKDIPLNIHEFHMWFKRHSSSEIKAFPYWKYKIDEKEHHYKIEKGKDNYWDVYEMEKPDKVYFSFMCSKGLAFAFDFEENLKLQLDKKTASPD